MATSKVIGTSRVTGWPDEFVPVTRSVRGYSPGPSVPPLTETVTVCDVPLFEGEVEG